MNDGYNKSSTHGVSWRWLLPARLDEEGLGQSVLYAMIAGVLALIFLSLGTAFFNPTNLVSVLQQTPEFALLSLAMGLSMVSGGIDLSIIAVANLAGIFAARLMTSEAVLAALGQDVAIGLACLVALAVGVCAGLLNGIVIVRFGIPPLLTTLGSMMVFAGLGTGLTGGAGITGMPAAYVDAVSSNVFGLIPASFCLVLVIFVGVSFFVNNSVFGKSLFLYGENKVAALFGGLRLESTILISYTICGALASLAGLVMLARFNSMKVGFGDSFQLEAILVAVLAGMDPDGGRGRLLNILPTVLLLQCVENAFTIASLSPFAKKMIWGALLLAFMALNFFFRRMVVRHLTALAVKRQKAPLGAEGSPLGG
ncbi:ABC transporter permease [Pleomorphomonas sp. JP5]|uniref:ABC transporter permease n=1 Tax=Pleomorphomonas sp. JP5 TaxID=2942998 RepID=UPI002043D69F|nr:ABC transporter permease [Pleomorphomonas sp. JP5]MCM5558171.1 ABC transporter permease [Pleomorphomonas sp. JP5]